MIRGRLIAAGLAVASIAACSGGMSALPAASPASLAPAGVAASKYVYVADRSQEKLFVYPAYRDDPTPIRTLGAADGLIEVEGIAVDRSGNVYVANGLAGNVLEFAPGATALVRTYHVALVHPVDVAVGAAGVLYVADQDDNYPYGVTSAVVEYPRGSTVPKIVLYDPSLGYVPIHSISVDGRGRVMVATSRIKDDWPPPQVNCAALPDDQLFYFIFTNLIVNVTLPYDAQVWGIAFGRNVLYASDPCSGLVQAYSDRSWQHAGTIPASSGMPGYLTIAGDRLVAIPYASADGKSGHVRELDSAGDAFTITKGLRGPIAAAAGP